MKKIINNKDDVTIEQLQGFGAAHPDLVKIHFEPNYVVRSVPTPKGKVALVSGGGSGHEPLHGGFVGKGMLDSACPGAVFTSPTPDQMYEAGKAAQNGGGVLNIVKNYTGDVLNFQMAAEMLNNEGIETLNIIIDDDVAVKDSSYTTGRRGVGTTVICEKICGAAAEAGLNLQQVAALARKVNVRGKSMGMALTSCIVPANGNPTFELGDSDIEIGIGIHGEPGSERTSLKSGDEITSILAERVLGDGAYTRKLSEWDKASSSWKDVEVVDEKFSKGDHAIALVNGMGGTPLSELYTVYGTLKKIADKHGVAIARLLIGNYITSIEMQGFSITLVKADEELLKWYDAPVHTPALRWGC